MLEMLHCRWPFECRAVCVERRPICHGVAGSALPGGVSAAAVSEAGDVTAEDLVGASGGPYTTASQDQ